MSAEPYISAESIEHHYLVLSHIGNLGPSPDQGYLRAAWSDEETEAMRYVEKAALDAGFSSRWDAIGNLCIETKGEYCEWVECASHMDTVPMGGNFDGAAGVISGLCALLEIERRRLSHKRGLRLRIWRGEESATFNALYAGSAGAFGQLDSRFLENRFQGQTLEQAISSQGFDPEWIRAGRPSISAEEVDTISAHVELHIEQGNLLEVRGVDIGVVTGIRGPYRVRVILAGEFDHSGATPMGLECRKDANLALGYILVALDQLAKSYLEQGADLVQTVGVINSQKELNETYPAVYQNAIPKVSGFAYFGLDIRSQDPEFLSAYRSRVDSLIVETAKRFKVQSEIQLVSFGNGIKELAPVIQDCIEESCLELGLNSMRMPSGAGHDAAVVAKQKRSDGSNVPVGMIFIPCRYGKSHSPDEHTTSEAISKGASVLARTLLRLAKKGGDRC